MEERYETTMEREPDSGNMHEGRYMIIVLMGGWGRILETPAKDKKNSKTENADAGRGGERM